MVRTRSPISPPSKSGFPGLLSGAEKGPGTRWPFSDRGNSKLQASTGLTLAHEVGLWVLYQRGFKQGEHHHKRQGILLSIYIQSLRFDKQLMNYLNTYG
jgi:hypothetical protein